MTVNMNTRVLQGTTTLAKGTWPIGDDLPEDVFGEAVMNVMHSAVRNFDGRINKGKLSADQIKQLRIEVTFE